ncbi:MULTISPECIES: cysteine hydrolase family protein [unclassified Curtobacterium]|uniref:cysteine hydrolase family protein n=1 Tax=unclassified Curtobacterium TaxID=257496 RepID=UPI000F498220|nr:MULTISPECIES: cysteine hydrolase [unclassified Curtobacterium]ROP66588.1 nicotinamidase-related amidase [Curtobacterium sp. PhB115]ROS34456.1 nicotinamidase-related amidase [Curtobacterium sp. PhB78]
MSTGVLDDAWLVVIDMQQVFTGESPWAAPRYDHAGVGIERLLPRFTGRTVFTRFVAPQRPQGAWVPYYREWPFALVPDADPLYALTEPFASAAGDRNDPVVTEPTFGKWGTGLQAVVGDHPHLVLTGVSTDCCVLSTALAAADAGATVTVVADACAGASDADHERALDAMRLYAPLITVVDSAARL